jgi:hypothetical protein
MIQEDVFNSDIDVSVALESYLDKVCTMLEYAGYTNYADDLIAEMFDIYLEATDRRKKADEIDKYLTDKGIVDAKSKTPHEAKKARQVRNFLMTQDFDPKTETIKSDHKDKNGKSPRIDLKLNDNKDYSSSEIENLIGLTNKTLKGKAANRAFITTHEKGHDLFSRDGRSAQWAKGNRDDYDNKNERGIKFINKAIDSGKKINDHDNGEYITTYNGGNGYSPEELEADLHASKTARVRTKYAGNKKAVKRSGATRNLNDTEIDKFYIYLYKLTKMPLQNIEAIYKSTLRTIKDCKQCIEMSSIIDEIRNTNPNEIDADKYISIIKNYDNYIKDTIKGMVRDIKLYEQFGSNIKKLETEIKNYDKSNDKTNNQQLEHLKEQLEIVNMIYSGYETNSNFNESYIYTYINRIYDYLKTIKSGGSTVIPKLPDPELLRKNINNLIKTIENKKSRAVEIKKKLDECDKILRKWHYDNRNLKPDESTQMRHDFVKQYLHEYFIEFVTEYYSSIFNEAV